MPVMSQAEIADLVGETRQRLGLTQTQLAQELGVSYRSVNRWENGRNIPLPMALKLMEGMLKQMGDRGKDLLERHFVE
jgi:DNA-binding transcriptional regulator YiaG